MKFQMFDNLFGLAFAVLISTGLTCAPAFSAGAIQNDPFNNPVNNPFGGAQVILPAAAQNAANNQDDKVDEQEDDTNVTDTKTLVQEKPDVAKNFVRFHMWDGTIVAGEVGFDSISVKTEFGVLEVPIEKVRRLVPGLDSFPDLKIKIGKLVEDLGNKDFDVREKAQRELSSLGVQIQNELNNYEDGGNAERKKRLAKIKEEISETMDDADSEETDSHPMIRGDSVVTPEFAIVGKILQETFSVNSKFGQLTIQLNDIKLAERSMVESRETIKKTIAVGAEKFFQRQTVSTRIRVNKGDKISVKANGVVQWTNWTKSSSPDGLANQGVYQGVKSGTLCARIGSSGKVIGVGSNHEWTASKSGVLYLAIAMQDNYVNNNNGYRWTGNYKARVTVIPATR